MRLISEGLERLAVATSVVREMDRRTIEEFGVPGIVLMENAGAGAVEVALDMLGAGRRVCILAGAGNNAGDGFVVARHLVNRGVDVRVITAVDPVKYKGDALTNFAALQKMEIPVETWCQCLAAGLGEADLLVDALLGTGLSGGLRPPYSAVIAALNDSRKPVLAIDIPSGLDGDTGEVATAAVAATKTATFALPKFGLYRGQGPGLAGEIVLVDIEMPRAVYPEGKVPGAA
ncbi:MAG: NAD(P)H-hydrate epimerase [Planctomycetota bacterium]|jgi:NAD(P)H-hydrate epimerase